MGTVATKFKSLLTDDEYEMIESNSEWFFWNRTISNYFYSFENQSHAHVFDATAIQTWWEVWCITVPTISKHEVFKMESWENLYKMVETLKW